MCQYKCGLAGTVRDSNMELLRIVAMFLVLVVHADFWSLGNPTPSACRQSPLMAYGQFFWGSVSMVCVNAFVLLSGWFGIKPKWSSFCAFLFQCLFFIFGIYILFVCLGKIPLSWIGVSNCFHNWWFIVSYIGLYVLSPMINAFVDNSEKIVIRNFLIAFFMFQTIFAYCSKAAPFLSTGCNSMSFVGLYVLARYVRMYPSRLTMLSTWTYWGIFLLITLSSSISAYLCTYMGYDFLIGRFYTYVSPFVIIPALILVLSFSRLNFSSKVVNWLAVSCFAVYLLHMHPCLVDYYANMVRYIVDSNNGFMVLLYLFLFMSMVFLLSVLIDKIRLCIWKVIYNALRLRKHYKVL